MSHFELGYTRDLYFLPFDHRGSFQKKLFGIQGAPNAEQIREIASYKGIIYEGFEKAVAAGVPHDKAGILVDEQFGTDVLRKAKARGFITACPVEKSGQEEFDFEYGSEFGAHLAKFDPTFVKVLVRYNPEGDAELNLRQAARLRELSVYCQTHARKFMFELLVPATEPQLMKVAGDTTRYDHELRPGLMIRAMQDLVAAGVEPDVWKLEGLETEKDCRRVAVQAKAGGRDRVGVIVLGRGENPGKVRHWLQTAARVPGLIGFAVGRTVFWDPLKAFRDGRLSREQAAEQVARNYKSFCDLWTEARSETTLKRAS